MAKNRNTFAKRERDMAKKRKAAEKREKRAIRRRTGDLSVKSDGPSGLTPGEQSVLDVFRKYLMTPGRMLCLATADLEAFRDPLIDLIQRGFLVAEKSQGGYSLTKIGYRAMNEGQQVV